MASGNDVGSNSSVESGRSMLRSAGSHFLSGGKKATKYLSSIYAGTTKKWSGSSIFTLRILSRGLKAGSFAAGGVKYVVKACHRKAENFRYLRPKTEFGTDKMLLITGDEGFKKQISDRTVGILRSNQNLPKGTIRREIVTLNNYVKKASSKVVTFIKPNQDKPKWILHRERVALKNYMNQGGYFVLNSTTDAVTALSILDALKAPHNSQVAIVSNYGARIKSFDEDGKLVDVFKKVIPAKTIGNIRGVLAESFPNMLLVANNGLDVSYMVTADKDSKDTFGEWKTRHFAPNTIIASETDFQQNIEDTNSLTLMLPRKNGQNMSRLDDMQVVLEMAKNKELADDITFQFGRDGSLVVTPLGCSKMEANKFLANRFKILSTDMGSRLTSVADVISPFNLAQVRQYMESISQGKSDNVTAEQLMSNFYSINTAIIENITANGMYRNYFGSDTDAQELASLVSNYLSKMEKGQTPSKLNFDRYNAVQTERIMSIVYDNIVNDFNAVKKEYSEGNFASKEAIERKYLYLQDQFENHKLAVSEVLNYLNVFNDSIKTQGNVGINDLASQVNRINNLHDTSHQILSNNINRATYISKQEKMFKLLDQYTTPDPNLTVNPDVIRDIISLTTEAKLQNTPMETKFDEIIGILSNGISQQQEQELETPVPELSNQNRRQDPPSSPQNQNPPQNQGGQGQTLNTPPIIPNLVQEANESRQTGQPDSANAERQTGMREAETPNQNNTPPANATQTPVVEVTPQEQDAQEGSSAQTVPQNENLDQEIVPNLGITEEEAQVVSPTPVQTTTPVQNQDVSQSVFLNQDEPINLVQVALKNQNSANKPPVKDDAKVNRKVINVRIDDLDGYFLNAKSHSKVDKTDTSNVNFEDADYSPFKERLANGNTRVFIPMNKATNSYVQTMLDQAERLERVVISNKYTESLDTKMVTQINRNINICYTNIYHAIKNGVHSTNGMLFPNIVVNKDREKNEASRLLDRMMDTNSHLNANITRRKKDGDADRLNAMFEHITTRLSTIRSVFIDGIEVTPNGNIIVGKGKEAQIYERLEDEDASDNLMNISRAFNKESYATDPVAIIGNGINVEKTDAKKDVKLENIALKDLAILYYQGKIKMAQDEIEKDEVYLRVAQKKQPLLRENNYNKLMLDELTEKLNKSQLSYTKSNGVQVKLSGNSIIMQANKPLKINNKSMNNWNESLEIVLTKNDFEALGLDFDKYFAEEEEKLKADLAEKTVVAEEAKENSRLGAKDLISKDKHDESLEADLSKTVKEPEKTPEPEPVKKQSSIEVDNTPKTKLKNVTLDDFDESRTTPVTSFTPKETEIKRVVNFNQQEEILNASYDFWENKEREILKANGGNLLNCSELPEFNIIKNHKKQISNEFERFYQNPNLESENSSISQKEYTDNINSIQQSVTDVLSQNFEAELADVTKKASQNDIYNNEDGIVTKTTIERAEATPTISSEKTIYEKSIENADREDGDIYIGTLPDNADEKMKLKHIEVNNSNVSSPETLIEGTKRTL